MRSKWKFWVYLCLYLSLAWLSCFPLHPIFVDDPVEVLADEAAVGVVHRLRSIASVPTIGKSCALHRRSKREVMSSLRHLHHQLVVRGALGHHHLQGKIAFPKKVNSSISFFLPVACASVVCLLQGDVVEVKVGRWRDLEIELDLICAGYTCRQVDLVRQGCPIF